MKPAKAQSTADRVRAMRQRREELGLMRLELYSHAEDHAAIKRYAARLQSLRMRQAGH